MTSEQMIEELDRLFPMPLWKEWIPVFEIKKVKNKLYLVSIGYAAVTQESSLYLFSETSHLRIDSGAGGLIHIEKIISRNSQIAVTYLRTPGLTRPDFVTATINKQGKRWQVRSKKKLNALQYN